MPAPIIFFPPFLLDIRNGRLQRGPRVIAVRPKSLEVLHYLASRGGELVTKNEILDRVWSDTHVTEVVLKVCISELRRALRDRAQRPKYLETVHRRGYRFIARLSPPPAANAGGTGADASAVAVAPAAASASACVGRETEAALLRGHLQQALAGERRAVFITGEAGIGKTTLLERFLAQARAAGGGLWVGRGQCVEPYGPGEAFLPILEALGRLCRGPGGKRLVAVLRAHAPSWLLQLPGTLAAADRDRLRQQCAGMEREQMLRQLLGSLEVLTTNTPIVIALEDLHWSDTATIELVNALACRREAARLLLIATYRPDEALVSGHPLVTMARELELRRCAVALALPPLSQASVGQYLAARLPGSEEDRHLQRLIYRHTNGNPLFMVHTVDHLLARGLLRHEDGNWRVHGELASIEAEVPQSLHQIIRTRIEQLPPRHRALLEAASVAGVAFSAAAMARSVSRPRRRRRTSKWRGFSRPCTGGSSAW
jgi:DNA-binding winged helix-turn-helix (wHTH) protein